MRNIRYCRLAVTFFAASRFDACEFGLVVRLYPKTELIFLDVLHTILMLSRYKISQLFQCECCFHDMGSKV